jgi:hypothetical protein
MTDADKIMARLDAIDKRLNAYDDLIIRLGCAVDENMDADRTAREIIKGAKAIGRLLTILAAVGRFALMFGGMVTVVTAMIAHWKGAP